jgi:ESS family glutamate:Na+ symporter
VPRELRTHSAGRVARLFLHHDRRAGFVGFGLGATPTAMANMTAVTQRHGASHVAFLVVPLVGAFFIDLLNAVVIGMFLAAL